MGAHSNAPRLRRARSILTVALLAGGALVWAAGPSQALPACPTPGNFEVDGDMLQGTCTPSADDWNTSGLNVQATSQGGTYNTGGGQAGKDGGDPTTWTSSGNTPDKTNFERAYATSRVVGNDFYVYVAWERTDTSGTQGYAIEIDNSLARTANDGTPQPNRDTGGAVVFISSQGSGAPQFNSACSFTSQATYGTTCTSSNANVTAAINTSSISDPIRGTTQAAGSFFEAVIDVSGITGIHPSCPGASAASVYLRSVTGQSSNGNLKGYMAPLSVAPDSTCVPPPISTTATPGGPLNAPGSSQHDTVTVGTGQAPGVGSVKFYLCTPGQVTAGGCEGSAGTLVDTQTLNANGQATSASINGTAAQATGNVTDNATGKYCWRAEFTPSANDTHYTAGTDTNVNATATAGDECFVIVHASPTIATQSSADTDSNAATNSIGFTTLGDVATLSGVASGTDLSNETITFNLYGPLDSAPGVNDCTVLKRIYGPVTAPLTQVNATTWHATAPTFKPTAADGAGFYTWIASYGGDSFNDAIAGHCGDANETRHLVGPLLTLTKGTPHSTITAGDDVVYDVNLGNVGEGSASGVVVTDVLPILAGGGTWTLTGTNGYNCSLAAGTGPNTGHQVLTCTVGQLDPSTLTQIAELSAPTTTADCGTISNTAVLAADPSVSQSAGPVNVTVQCPHITITKTADADSVTVGNPIGFTISVTNDGAGTATNVDVEDTLPTGAHISWTIDNANTSGPLTCGIAAGKLSCTGSLASGATETVHITSPTAWNVDGNSCGTYTNTASVSADNAVIDNPQASDSEDVLCPDLHITKTHDAAAVNAGTSIGFTITASNTGAGTATGALISDPLPSGVTWSIDAANTSGPLTCGISSGTLTCSGTLLSGQSETVHITAPTAFADCGTYDNTATFTAGNTPQAPQGEATTKVLCANVVVHKDADHADPVSVGTDIGFTVTVNNTGDGAAVGVHVNDPLPAGSGVNWTIESQSGPLTCTIDGSPPNETLKCDGDLAATGNAGDTETVHIVSSTVWNADHNSCGEYDNTAHLTWDNGPNQTISSNKATETVQCPDLHITKTADDATVSAGSNIGFEIDVNNAGPGTATSVTLHDPLPAGAGVDWQITPAYSGPGTCSITGQVGSQVLDCSFGDLAATTSFSIHISSGTTAASCQAYDNTATLHSTNEPGIPPGEDTTTVLCPAPAITKVADHDTVNAGEQIGFTITASNGDAPGTGTATGVVIDDPLPGGTGIDWTIASGPNNCTINGTAPNQTLHCTAVDLTPGSSESVHVVSNTTFGSCALINNTATLTGSNFDQKQASDDTTVQCPSLTLAKTADDVTVDAGDDIGFTVTVSNGGPGVAKDVVVNDPLPGGPGIDWHIVSGPNNCSINTDQQTGDQTLVCTKVDLASGGGETIHVQSGTDFTSCAVYDNTATLTASNSPSPDPAHASTTVQCADLTITKVADNDTVDAGAQIGFQITVSNSDAVGTGTAHGVTINDPLPGGSGIDWTMDPAVQDCSINTNAQTGDQTLHCGPVDLGPGDSLTVHIVSDTTFASCKAYPNTATLAGSNVPGDEAEDTTTVQCPDLSLTKTADDDPVSAGDPIGFTVTVSNADGSGTGTAHDVVISDPLPSGTGVNWTIDPAVQGCSIDTDPQTGDQTLTCGPLDLGPGDSLTVHVTSPTTGDSCQTYPNEAVLSATDNHPALTADASTTVQCPDVTLVKTPDAATVSAGEQIGFTVTASNSDATGTGQAKGVAIDDPLPGGSDITWTIESGPANCTIDTDAVTGQQVLTCSAVDLAPGDSESVHVVSQTTPQSCAVYDNTATLTLTNGAAPEPAEASTEVQCPALGISKTADADRVRAGNDIGFVVTVANAGPGVAFGGLLTDPLPSGKGVSWSIDSSGTTAPGCNVSDQPSGQVLTCALGDMAAGVSYTVHLVSGTTNDSCATYPNVATVSASNGGELTADADTRVVDCLGTGGTTPPPSTPPAHGTSGTGAPVQGELELVVVLLGAGLALLVIGRRRRSARH